MSDKRTCACPGPCDPRSATTACTRFLCAPSSHDPENLCGRCRHVHIDPETPELKKIRFECVHPHDQVDPRRYDGINTVCHRCKQMVSITVSYYANGETTDQQYATLVAKMNRASVASNEPIRLPDGVLGVCTNCGQWLRGRQSDATVDCVNECVKRGVA